MTGAHGTPVSRAWLILLLAALSAIGLLLAEQFVERQRWEAHRIQHRNAVREQMSLLQSRLEGYLRANTLLVRGLVSVIAYNPALTQAEFERAARPLLGGHSQLRNIAGAPDMVIRLMFPLAGNEKAIGLDYRTSPTQREAAQRARETGEIVLAGPVQLAQGGVGLIGRFPVFADTGPHETRFWGLVSAVIDVERLYRDSGLLDATLPIDISIRGRDAQGQFGDVFFGDAELFEGDSEKVTVWLPAGSWQMAARPKGGWAHTLHDLVPVRLGFALVALLILGPMLMLAWIERQRYQAALKLHQTLRDLEAAHRAAEAASMAKSEFLAAIGHEIRTPMHGVLGMADLLLTTQLDEEQKGFIQTLKKSAQALLEVINQIIDYSQLDAGRLKLEETDFVPATLVADTCASVRPEAEAKGLSLTVDCAPGPAIRLHGDAGYISQVLRIFLGNAIKFTDQGRINLALTRSPGGAGRMHLRFAVTDSGVGLAPGAEAQLFDPFTHGDGSLTRRHAGAGLGLAKAKRLVEAMGGELGVQRMPEQGACFWFEITLPVAGGVATESSGQSFARGVLPEEYSALPVLDRAMLDNLKKATGLSARDLYGMLRDQVVQETAAIEVSCTAGNSEEVQRLIQSIKTASQQLGALRLVALTRTMEKLAGEACVKACPGLLAQCRRALDELAAEIETR